MVWRHWHKHNHRASHWLVLAESPPGDLTRCLAKGDLQADRGGALYLHGPTNHYRPNRSNTSDEQTPISISIAQGDFILSRRSALFEADFAIFWYFFNQIFASI